MNSSRVIRIGHISPNLASFRSLNTIGLRSFRNYSTEAAKKKKKTTKGGDISQVPIKNIGVIADYYVPPKLLSSPITSWIRLIGRRIGVFAINTYSVVKFRRETGLKLTFNEWKDEGIDKYVKINKIFSNACSYPLSKRAEYLKSQLDGVSGTAVQNSLTIRALSFSSDSRLNWELVKIVGNPKIISFSALPDNNNITTLVQFVMSLKTVQKFTVSTIGKDPVVSERTIESYLVYTLDPFSKEIVLVGSMFESDHKRGVHPEINFNSSQAMLKFQNSCADIYRPESSEVPEIESK